MFTIVEALIALAPHIAALVETMCASCYDQEAEKQALLNMERGVADARAAKVLAG